MKQPYDYERSNSEPAVIEHTPPTIPPPTGDAGGGILQTIGLAPGTAIAAIGVDVLPSGGDLISLGALLPFSVLAAGGLGFFTYRMQRNWGDDHNTAIAKAVLIGLVTAIPVPITPILAAPAGIAGFLRNLTRK